MARKRILSLCLAVIALIFPTKGLAYNDGKLMLTVGETRELKLEKAVKVHVTRKGIIHLIHLKDDLWQITALRSGVVAIESKVAEMGTKTIYVQVTHPMPSNGRNLKSAGFEKSNCSKSTLINSTQYEVRTIVEMANQINTSSTGEGLAAAIHWTPGVTTSKIALDSSIFATEQDRKIIGDPVITANPCVAIEIHAGGEERIESRFDGDSTTSTWKLHGLAINMELIPISSERLRIPYRISLRTPTKGSGSYTLSEAKASLDTTVGHRKLAAIINLSSRFGDRKSSFFMASVPIIGPLLTGRSDSSSLSKLIIWIEVKKLKMHELLKDQSE